MSRIRLHRALGTLAAIAFAGCAHASPQSVPTAAPSPPSTVAEPSAGAAGTSVPITFVAPRVGDRYVYLTKQRGNRKVYVLRADAEKGQYFGADTGRSTFVNPHVTFYGTIVKSLVADAPAGVVVERARTVLMSGGVHALAQNGVRLTSDTLLYNDGSQTIHATGNVIMQSADGTQLRGQTLDWNLPSGSVQVAGGQS